MIFWEWDCCDERQWVLRDVNRSGGLCFRLAQLLGLHIRRPISTHFFLDNSSNATITCIHKDDLNCCKSDARSAIKLSSLLSWYLLKLKENRNMQGSLATRHESKGLNIWRSHTATSSGSIDLNGNYAYMKIVDCARWSAQIKAIENFSGPLEQLANLIYRPIKSTIIWRQSIAYQWGYYKYTFAGLKSENWPQLSPIEPAIHKIWEFTYSFWKQLQECVELRLVYGQMPTPICPRTRWKERPTNVFQFVKHSDLEEWRHQVQSITNTGSLTPRTWTQ